MDLHEFDEQDWEYFGDAERFPGKKSPIIGDGAFADGRPLTLIVSKGRAEVMFPRSQQSANTEDDAYMRFDHDFASQQEASDWVDVALGDGTQLTQEILLAVGFTEVPC